MRRVQGAVEAVPRVHRLRGAPPASGSLACCTPRRPCSPRAGFPFETFAHVVDNGEHLEHFHAYTKEERLEGEDTRPGTGSVAAVAAAANDDGTTLPMHTDQGLFIAFTPALVVRRDGAVARGDDSTFLVRLSDGTVESVSFDADSLVFMIGHGVEQVVRPKLLPGGLMPRATPHAVTSSHHATTPRLSVPGTADGAPAARCGGGGRGRDVR